MARNTFRLGFMALCAYFLATCAGISTPFPTETATDQVETPSPTPPPSDTPEPTSTPTVTPVPSPLSCTGELLIYVNEIDSSRALQSLCFEGDELLSAPIEIADFPFEDYSSISLEVKSWATFSANAGADFSLMPDGKHLVISRQGVMTIVDLETGVREELPIPNDTIRFNLSPSPNGDYILYARPRETYESGKSYYFIEALHIETGTISHPLPDETIEAYDLPYGGPELALWSPTEDSTILLYTRWEFGPTPLHFGNIECAETTHECVISDIVEMANFPPITLAPVWSPDGTQFVDTCNRNLCIFDLNGDVIGEFYPDDLDIRKYSIWEPRWSPDGSAIVFIAEEPDRGDPNYVYDQKEIYILYLDKGNVVKLTHNQPELGEVIWVP